MSKRDEKRETRTADAASAGSGERKPSAIHRIFTGLFRLVLVLLETVLLVAMLLYGVMYVVAKGPSPTARDLFVMSVRETSAIGFLANLYFTDEEIAQIEARKDSDVYVETDTSLITINTDNLQNTDAEAGPQTDEWGLIDEDGDFHVVFKADAGSQDGTVNGKRVINAFFFGPALVVEGKPVEGVTGRSMSENEGRQRMCIAQVGPLHYKAICCAGPARGNAGMTLKQFASFVASQGVQTAYNLDGGDSTMIIFRNEKINDVQNASTRSISDIIYFASAWEGKP